MAIRAQHFIAFYSFCTARDVISNANSFVLCNQGISAIAKTVIAISISIFIKLEIAIAISIAIWKKFADRDRGSFAIADLLADLFTYC